MDLNNNFFLFLYGFVHKNALFDSLVIFLATDFALLVLFALVYFLYKHENLKRGLRELLIVLGSGALAWGVAHLIKNFYPMPRPDVALDGVVSLFTPDDLNAFPSGHATFFSALAVGLYFYHKKLGIFFGVCAIIIALARVIAGVHFPGDILAGFVLGGVISYAVHYLSKKYF